MLFLASTFSSAALQLPARSSVASHSRAAVSMIAPVEVETKKAVEGPTLSSMVKRSLGSAPARLLCLLRARQTGSKAAWHSQEEAGASSPRQSLLQKAADSSCVFQCRFSKSLATPDPIPEEGQKRALELMKSGALFRYTPGVESETALARAAVSIKRPRGGRQPIFWPARPRWGQGAAARSGREGPDSHAHAHPHATQAEWDMTEKTGFKYAVGFNSCGACLHLPTGAHAQPEREHSTPSRPFSSHSRPSLTLPLNPHPHPKPRP